MFVQNPGALPSDKAGLANVLMTLIWYELPFVLPRISYFPLAVRTRLSLLVITSGTCLGQWHVLALSAEEATAVCSFDRKAPRSPGYLGIPHFLLGQWHGQQQQVSSACTQKRFPIQRPEHLKIINYFGVLIMTDQC